MIRSLLGGQAVEVATDRVVDRQEALRLEAQDRGRGQLLRDRAEVEHRRRRGGDALLPVGQAHRLRRHLASVVDQHHPAEPPRLQVREGLGERVRSLAGGRGRPRRRRVVGGGARGEGEGGEEDQGAEPTGEATRRAPCRCAAKPHDVIARRATHLLESFAVRIRRVGRWQVGCTGATVAAPM